MNPKKSLSGRIVKLTEINQRLKRKREVVPKSMRVIDDWPNAALAMERDKIGVGEGYVLTVPDEVLQEFPDLKAVARPIKKYVRKTYGHKYFVEAKNTDEGPTIIISQPLG